MSVIDKKAVRSPNLNLQSIWLSQGFGRKLADYWQDTQEKRCYYATIEVNSIEI